MPSAKFNHSDVRLVKPSFDSPLTDLIIVLDHLRKKKLMGSTHPKVFFQLKHIFHTLESVGSARIEGNNTTIAEYIETKLEEKSEVSSSIKEIQNIEKAMTFVEESVKDYPINRLFVSEIHKLVTAELPPPPDSEGDYTPGEYRKKNVNIAQSSYIPPDFVMVDEYMDQLFNFISNHDSPKYDLLKAAIAHHRFVWIHPFTNGNGRTVRLFTYAMLVKLGFNIDVGRILNPTAIFCINRNDYYRYLSQADTGTDQDILSWCEYVLKGLKEEIEKIDKLLDYKFLSQEILLPTIDYSLERQYITEVESKVLKLSVDKKIIRTSDLKNIFSGKFSQEISRQIRKLIDKKMLLPEVEGKRKYTISFNNSYLLRGIIKFLGEKGFLPLKDEII
jgi:Fic family protein